jgi:hypothetical protein
LVLAVIVYVFLIQRKQDSEPWPCVYTNAELADKAVGRVSPVVAVNLEAEATSHG